MDVGFRHDASDAVASALGVEPRDPVDQPHAVSGDRERAGHTEAGELLAERAGQVTTPERLDLSFVVGLLAHGDQLSPVVGPPAGHGPLLHATQDDALAGVELPLGEESRRALPHGHEQAPVDGSVELEAEQPGVALPEEP